MYEYKIYIKDKTIYKVNYDDLDIKYIYIFVTSDPKIFIEREVDSCIFNMKRKTSFTRKKSTYSMTKILPKDSNIQTKNRILRVKSFTNDNIVGLDIFSRINSGKTFFVQKNVQKNKIWNNNNITFEKGYIDIMDNFGIFHRWKVASLKCDDKRSLISTINLITPFEQRHYINCDINELILKEYYYTV